MESIKLDKNQTGIASEYYVAGELSRLGFNVAMTFGNTKSIDLIVERDGTKPRSIQVKGMQTTKSICWNLDKTKIKPDILYVLVNLHVNDPHAKPEFFVLTAKEAQSLFKDTPKEGEKRTYLDYNYIKRLGTYENRWDKI